MKFKLRTSQYFYPEKEDRDALSKLGFTFTPCEFEEFRIEGSPKIEINTLEELIAFVEKYGDIIIFDNHYNPDENIIDIEIYNDHRE